MRAAALVQDAHDVPFIVRALAEGGGRLERVVIAERRISCETLVHRLPELRIGPETLVEVLLDLQHVSVTIEREVAGKILRPNEVHEIEILSQAFLALENLCPHEHVIGAGSARNVLLPVRLD